MQKTIYILATAVTLIAANAKAQTDNGSTGNVSMSAYVSDQIENFPPAAQQVLSNKLTQIITQNGVTNGPLGSRFIVTPNISVMSKDITPTAPPMTALNLDITFFVGDGIEGRKFASKTVSVKGVGTNETKAYIEAIKMIKPADPALASLIAEGKKKIIEYYTANCDVVIKNAQAAASGGNYEEAISQLSGVPEAAKACYDKSMAAAAPMYKKLIDQQCNVKLTEARAAWNADQNSGGASNAGALLASINPEAACYKDAVALNNEISKRMQELGNKEWDYKMKEQQGNIDLAKSRIEAYRDINVAYHNSKRNVVNLYSIRWW